MVSFLALGFAVLFSGTAARLLGAAPSVHPTVEAFGGGCIPRHSRDSRFLARGRALTAPEPEKLTVGAVWATKPGSRPASKAGHPPPTRLRPEYNRLRRAFEVMRAAVTPVSSPRLPRPVRRSTRPDAAAFLAALAPLDVYLYAHSGRILFKRPLTTEERQHLADNCQSLDVHRHGQWIKDASGAFRQLNIFPFREQVQLVGANRVALAYLASRDDRIPRGNGALPKRDRQPPLIIYLEIALDIILANEQILREAFAAFKRCFVQLWNGKNESIEFDNGGMSTGRRWNGKYLSAYISKPSPVTGEVDCLHIEYRICSARAVRAVGIASIADLLAFDFRAFWQKHLVLRDVDIARLGRHSLNKRFGKRRQEPGPDDRRTGQVLWRAYAYDKSGSLCVQALIQNYGSGPFLKNIPIAHFLPSSGENALVS
ncbi:hypothetical protein HNQ36_003311 [Afipia massiliensis]|uniref:Uncharacterized protein n=1 Tax=Afipia massiliensis TaxID=211460 RepID=A0A840N2K8_9BRAD|nr:hypothetical protein [Afipia massiliensis]